VVNAQPFELNSQLMDPSTALVGRRDPQQRVICTLHGVYTGLGNYRYGDVDVINYGPQHPPFENCQGFGIEGNAITDHGERKTDIQITTHGFIQRGCVRLVDMPPQEKTGGYHFGQYSGIWFETTQELNEHRLQINTRFLGFAG